MHIRGGNGKCLDGDGDACGDIHFHVKKEARENDEHKVLKSPPLSHPSHSPFSFPLFPLFPRRPHASRESPGDTILHTLVSTLVSPKDATSNPNSKPNPTG